MRLTKLSTGRNHRFSRIGQPKNAKSPIAGASLRRLWQEHCYTVASVLQCPRHQKQNTLEIEPSRLCFWDCERSYRRKATSGVLSRIVATPAQIHTQTCTSGAHLGLTFTTCTTSMRPPGWVCVTLVQYSEVSTHCTPKGASRDGVELGANPGTRLHCSDAPLQWPMKRCPGSVRKDLARASPNPVNRNFFCGAG